MAAGCAHTPTSSPHTSPREIFKSATPEQLVEHIVTSWEEEDAETIIALFHPHRRPLARASRAQITSSISQWQITAAAIDPRCHGHGPDYLMVRVSMAPRDAILTSPDEEMPDLDETFWLVFDERAWWLHAL